MGWNKTVGGEGGAYVTCPPGTYMGVIVGLFDIGTQPERKQDGTPNPTPKIVVAVELTKRQPDGAPFVLAVKYSFFLSEKANLYKNILLPVLGTGPKAGSDFNILQILGRPVMVSVINTESDGKAYHDVKAFSAFPDGLPVPEPTHFPVAWSIDGDDMAALAALTWMPRPYGKSIREYVEMSAEYREARGLAAIQAEGPRDTPHSEAIPAGGPATNGATVRPGAPPSDPYDGRF